MSASHPPEFVIDRIDAFERPVRLRLPFRFGAATVREASQAFVRTHITSSGGRASVGWSAELMVPKWFDKRPERTQAQNIDDLRAALRSAIDAYESDRAARTAFGHAAAHYLTLVDTGARNGLNALTASFGAAIIDRSLTDAVCKSVGASFAQAVNVNLLGVDGSLAPDLDRFDVDAFLRTLVPVSSIAARHTVGLLDAVSKGDATERPGDDLPVSLDEVIARYANRFFKLKLCGSVEQDVDRLASIAAILDGLPDYRVTLDGNEQFASVDTVIEFVCAMKSDRRLARLASSVLYLEQPLPRDISLATDVHPLATHVPLLIDESDATMEAFVDAARLGYTGVSTKSCKGMYKSLVNAARCVIGREHALFMSAEDLTIQAGLAVQQDLALVAVLGLSHVERNGHHYVDGFAGQGASSREATAFATAHPDLYRTTPTGTRLAVSDGVIALSSIGNVGFATGVTPDLETLSPMTTGRGRHADHGHPTLA